MAETFHPESFPQLYPSPARVLAECEAKRRMVDEREGCANAKDDQGRPASMLLKSHAGWLRILAAVYADHPDFDPEWRA